MINLVVTQPQKFWPYVPIKKCSEINISLKYNFSEFTLSLDL